MIRVAIESPYAGDVAANIAYLKRCILDSLERGESPYASHLFFTQDGLLDDKLPIQRKLGIVAGFAWAATADIVAIYVDRGISRGVEEGVARALAANQRIEFRSIEGADLAEYPTLLGVPTSRTDERRTPDDQDWTFGNGRTNNSELYLKLVADVAGSIESCRVGDSPEVHARVIVSRLAHIHGLAPRTNSALVDEHALLRAKALAWSKAGPTEPEGPLAGGSTSAIPGCGMHGVDQQCSACDPPAYEDRACDASFQRDAEAWARADAAADQQRYDLLTARSILGEGSSLMLQWKVAQAILDAREEGRRSTDYPIPCWPTAGSVGLLDTIERTCKLIGRVWGHFDPFANEPNDCFCGKSHFAGRDDREYRFRSSGQALEWVETVVSSALEASKKGGAT